jgi:amidase
MLRHLVPLLLAAAAATTTTTTTTTAAFVLEESTIESIHRAFAGGALTSRGLVELYLLRIASLDPVLHAVIELDADAALAAADRADADRLLGTAVLPPLHGIPVLIKDNIAAASAGALNATAGSLALVGSRPARDAGVVARLRSAGAVILGTASLSEWCNFRAPGVPAGWSPRGGQGMVSQQISPLSCLLHLLFRSLFLAWDLELQVDLLEQGRI